MNLKVLGTGCKKCKTLETVVLEVVSENNFDAEIQKLENIVQIINFGIMTTPALLIYEKIAFSGSVPSKSEIKIFIEKAINE